ncbi:MAG: CBS domain-containing protein [Candidatus Methanomethylicia archaeon]|jgi:signal-transduction protein with cAMP-binding, CBS, and nucleotidyltransferase domain|nr:CBS domain-containing protein [Candidatus Methanomethylicia archaeon]MCQ5340198.1 CBS domain-containing protein [Candidatus Methanomethylicia archaeon]NHV45594.1 CBS domain-containing protein [Candidatus Verstraetearchaeota archaeon]
MAKIRTLHVEDVMRKDVIKLPEEANVRKVAIEMSEKGVGSIVITHNDHPVGIITERDLVSRVIAKGLDPEKTLAKEIMSSPLFVISPKAEIMEAARKMSSLNIRRLIVVKDGKMIGIITSRDILNIAPEFIEILIEASKNRLIRTSEEEMVGYCDNCEEWSDSLKEVNGQFLCENCRLEFSQ